MRSVKRYFIPIGIFLLIAGIVMTVRQYRHNADCVETTGTVLAICNGGKKTEGTHFGSPVVLYYVNGNQAKSRDYQAPYDTYTVGETTTFYYKASDISELTEPHHYKDPYIALAAGAAVLLVCINAVKGWFDFPKAHPDLCVFTGLCIGAGVILYISMESHRGDFLGGMGEALLLVYGGRILIPVNFILWFLAALNDDIKRNDNRFAEQK